jgi:hypothetical protein
MLNLIPHPSNVPGDFYVENGCCISCNMPFTVADDLFSRDSSDGSCFVSKQPSNGREIYRMLNAFEVQDVGCIRYKGSSRVIKIKLIAMGEGDQCDQLDEDLVAIKQEVNLEKDGLRGVRSEQSHNETITRRGGWFARLVAIVSK